MLKRIFIAAMLLALPACSTGHVDDLKSPCAGIEGSPCVHRPVNDWWLKRDVSETQTSGLFT